MKTLYEIREILNKIPDGDLKQLLLDRDTECTGKICIMGRFIDEDEEEIYEEAFDRNEFTIDKLNEIFEKLD